MCSGILSWSVAIGHEKSRMVTYLKRRNCAICNLQYGITTLTQRFPHEYYIAKHTHARVMKTLHSPVIVTALIVRTMTQTNITEEKRSFKTILLRENMLKLTYPNS